MRNSVRVDNFLSKVDIRDLLLNIWKICDDSNIDDVEKSILNDIDKIKHEWKLFYDQRFSQILVNNGYIPYMSDAWYYYEEDEILKMQGYKPRDYIFWGSIYNSDGELLEETRYSLIKDLEISHLQKIIEGNWLNNKPFMRKILTDELRTKSRREKLKQLKNIS